MGSRERRAHLVRVSVPGGRAQVSQPLSWISVGELEDAFTPETNASPLTGELAGRSFRFGFENGWTMDCRFATDRKLFWNRVDPSPPGDLREEAYCAFEVRDGIYFVDFVVSSQAGTAMSLVVDLSRGVVTALIGRLPTEGEARQSLLDRLEQGKELTSVAATFLSGAVGRAFTAETPRHRPTDELVGRHVEYTYSPTERYEHVYLNENLYTWHCLLGSERGLADTDRCHCLKLADELYLFVWREKVVPTLGAVVVDLQQMKTTGKILGYRGGDFGTVSNFTVGARARLLNVTPRQPPRDER
ncbi:MAG: molybdenum cofactor biosynthesis F family protein [Deltaproteobacteria bacterium]|nr:molybdenum cofactor biosynthesis F family protein [Deltaproteobacteria bacterium]